MDSGVYIVHCYSTEVVLDRFGSTLILEHWVLECACFCFDPAEDWFG